MQEAIEGTVDIRYLCTYDHIDAGEYVAILYNQRNRQVPCQFVNGETGAADTVQFLFSYPWYRIKSQIRIDFQQKGIVFDWPGMNYYEVKRSALADGGFEVRANLYVQKNPDAYMDMFSITITIPGHRPPEFEEFDLEKLRDELQKKFLEDHPEYV